MKIDPIFVSLHILLSGFLQMEPTDRSVSIKLYRVNVNLIPGSLLETARTITEN